MSKNVGLMLPVVKQACPMCETLVEELWECDCSYCACCACVDGHECYYYIPDWVQENDDDENRRA